MKILAAILIMVASAGAATKHAPLPPSLLAAKTLYIDNQSGDAKIADRCYQELAQWGRFQIVSAPKDADVIFRLGTHTQTYGYSGQSTTNESGYTNTSMTANSEGFTTISILDQSGTVLWSDTRRWGNIYMGFRSATKAVLKDLRKRMEEQ